MHSCHLEYRPIHRCCQMTLKEFYLVEICGVEDWKVLISDLDLLFH